MRRAITSLWRTKRHDEGGFTLVELMVTMSVMCDRGDRGDGRIASDVRTTNTVTDRRDVFNDGRFAIDQLTTQIRQGESIDTTSDAQTLRLSGYIDGTAKTIVWRTTGTTAPYTLEQSRRTAARPYVDAAELARRRRTSSRTPRTTASDQVTVDDAADDVDVDVDLTTDVHLQERG